MGALALRLAILCASRSQEVRGARWSEIDFEAKVWTIPAERMKMRRAHRVPLSAEALIVFQEAASIHRAGTDLVFPGRDGWLSDMTLTKALRDLGHSVTQHGFRSSFRDWVADKTGVAEEVAKAALSHAENDKVVAAYRRTDFLDARRPLMAAWGAYCGGATGADIVQLNARRA
jgi:integrase